MKFDYTPPTSAATLLFFKKQVIEGEPNFTTYEASLSTDVANRFRDWLLRHFRNSRGREFDEYTPEATGAHEVVRLEGVIAWAHLREKIIANSARRMTGLSKITTGLTGYIVFVQSRSGFFGLIRRIPSSHVLAQEGSWSLHFDGNTFNSLERDKGVKVDDWADILFVMNEDGEIGLVQSKNNFYKIFDLGEQHRTTAAKLIQNFTELQTSPNLEFIKERVQRSKRLQTRLVNYSNIFGPTLVAFKTIVTHKASLGSRLHFEIDNGTIVLSPADPEKGVEDLIDVLTGRHFWTLDQVHLIKGSPREVIR